MKLTLFIALLSLALPLAAQTTRNTLYLEIVDADGRPVTGTSEIIQRVIGFVTRTGLRVESAPPRDAPQVNVRLIIDIDERGRSFARYELVRHSLEESPYVLFSLPPETVPEEYRTLPYDIRSDRLNTAQWVSGVALYGIGECNESVRLMEQAARAAARTGASEAIQQTAAFYVANCALLGGDIITATRRYEALFEDPVYAAPASLSLAWMLLERDDEEGALEALRSVTAEDNLHLTLRARLFASLFDYDAAIAELDTAIEQEADDPALFDLRGELTLLLYEWNRALDDFNTAIELDADYAPAYYRRGTLYYTMNEREMALADFVEYLRLVTDGEYAEEAAAYIESIEVELEALDD